MTISEQEQYAARIAKRGDVYIGLLWVLGELISERHFSNKLDAVSWWESNSCCRLYDIYTSSGGIISRCELSYAK